MPSFFTPRRFLVYSAYFIGAFSLIIGLFISKHAWDLHTTIRLIEKSWDVRGYDYSNSSWIEKAAHALFAGHEDVSEYNTKFWGKFRELEEGEGSWDRSYLSPCDKGYEPEWATKNAGYEKWGFVLYRTDYDEDEETWAETVRQMNYTIRTHLELEATADGLECDPGLVRDRAVLEIIEDRETLDGATAEDVRALWRKRVDDGLVDASMKMGGWRWGWFRLNINKHVPDGERKEANGISLNLCLMYDWHARVMSELYAAGVPATGPRDPWEPFLVAVDGMWSPDEYMYLTSWAEGYAGSYGVALSILFNDFHRATFEREMERHAPYMFNGGPIVDASASWWLRILQALLSTTHAVARPGHFPFHNRWQEMQLPFVREDSHWKKPEDAKNAETDESAADLRSSENWIEEMLNPRPPKIWLPCLDPENDKGCFKMGNLYVREPEPEPAPEPELEPSKETTADEAVNDRSHDQVVPAEEVIDDRSHEQAPPAEGVIEGASHERVPPAEKVTQGGIHEQVPLAE